MIHESVKRRDVADAKAIGLRIRAARKSRGWAIRDLAEAIGRAEQTIACWECGARVPHTWTMLIRLCHALRRSSDWLVYGVSKRGALWRMIPPERTGGGGFRALPGSTAVPSASGGVNGSTPFSDPVGGSAGIPADRAEE